ncbi:hypothetical protein DMN91_008380 [Ooceraea biroi]|uniref:THAP-type domain-containing protein n=1 Tax=Ooceraea biroi TaxID=2015173 RepID=A0A3L8DHK0_OOCBI|nr:hypothetical protein DMN91_008380 [Ooceraea biroi]
MMRCDMHLHVDEPRFSNFCCKGWLQWIRAANRLDLEQKGPHYAYNNCTLCHLHFEEKWFRRKTTLRLHPDAVPTLFFGFENTEAEVEILEVEIQAEAEMQREAETQAEAEI